MRNHKNQIIGRAFLLAAIVGLLNSCSEEPTKKKPAHFVTISVVPSTTTFGSYALDVTVKNDGETTGYNVDAVINALQGTTIVDTGRAYPANLGDIIPGQSAKDQAVFFKLTPTQAASLTFSTPVITFISK